MFILRTFSFKMAFCFILYLNQFLKGPFIVSFSLMFTFWHECLVVSVLQYFEMETKLDIEINELTDRLPKNPMT